MRVLLTDGDWRLMSNPETKYDYWQKGPYIEHRCHGEAHEPRWSWFIVFYGADVAVERCGFCNQQPPEGMISSMWFLGDQK